MLDLCLRVALLSTLCLYVSSLSLKRELESVDTKALDELASGNDKNMKKKEYDGKQGEQADKKSLVKRVHHLYGKLKLGGLGGQNDHWSSSSWNWRNALMKRGKDEKTKSAGGDNSSIDKRAHRLYGNLKFGGLGGQNQHFAGSSWNWRNALVKRGKYGKTKSAGGDNSGIDKRAHRLYGNVRFGGPSGQWLDLIGSHSNAFKNGKREKDEQTKLAGVDRNREKRAHRLYGNLKFGGLGQQNEHWAGSTWNWRNAFNKMKRGKDGEMKSGRDNSGIDKRAHHVYSNVRFGGPSGQWLDLIGSRSNAFKNVKREKDEQVKSAGVDRNREKRAHNFIAKLKFGGRPGGGLSWNMNNPFNYLKQDGATN